MDTPKAQWTILIYIAAHNNLEMAGRRSLDQILGVGSSPHVKLAVLFDRPAGATRYIAGEPGQVAVEEPLGDFDSGDPQTLVETARWAFTQLPAERYGLVLWSHGSGWQPEYRERSTAFGFSAWTPEEIERIAKEVRGDDQVTVDESLERGGQAGSMALFRSTLAQILKHDTPAERAICFDDGSSHALDTVQLERVMREIEAIVGQPLDLLGLDACVMATLEVAYQVRQYVRHLVSSEELVPGYSWPYDTILGALRDRPGMSGTELAQLVVQHYVDYYTDEANRPPLNTGDVTKVALDLGRVQGLVTAVDDLAGALLADMERQATHFWNAQRATRAQETLEGRRQWNKFNYHLWDLGTLVAHLAAHSDNASVREAAQTVKESLRLGGTVVAEGHCGAHFDGIGGVAIYAVPPPPPRPPTWRLSPYYHEVALAQDTRWGQMLVAYHNALR